MTSTLVSIDATAPDAARRVAALIGSNQPVVLDTVAEQLAELGRPADAEIGTWVYFPWDRRLVRYLPEALHTELRTSRNRELVTRAEQDRLRAATVAIAGLSLGNGVALTLTVGGIAKHLRLADHDVMSGSNTNRIRRGFSSISLPKTDLAAREIYDIDPYADLQLFPDGVTADNLERFVLWPEPVSVLVDEVDNAYAKVQLRRLARAHRIPVVAALDVGDAAFVDVERFDLDDQAPLFHGAVSEAELARIGPDAGRREFADLVTRWIGRPIDGRLRHSMNMVLSGELAGWPQLASTAFLAASAVAFAVRRVILGQPTRAGGVWISFDDAFR